MTEETIKEILKFRDDRDWKQFHNPKDLAISISLEAAELLDTGAVETLLREVRAYTDGLCAALEDMRSALQKAAE